jgi:hypothetical protein
MMRSAALAVAALVLAGCASDAGSASDPAAGSSGSAASAPAGATAATESEAAEAGSAEVACTPQQTAPHPELRSQLPAGLPTVTGWQPTQVTDQGRTRAVSGVLPGEAGDLVSVRDDVADRLVGSGYHQSGTDEEAGYEAEAEFEGAQEVTIKVRPMCRGYLVLTYTVQQ